MTTDQQILDHCRRMNGRPGDGIPQWQIEAAEEFRDQAKRDGHAELALAIVRHARALDNLPGPSE